MSRITAGISPDEPLDDGGQADIAAIDNGLVMKGSETFGVQPQGPVGSAALM